MSFTPWFPEPGSYIRYRSPDGIIKYRRLNWRRDPMVYPRRFPALTAGSKGDGINFDEINPSETKKHIYLAYLGVRPGFLYYLWHPYDIKTLKWDEDITDIEEDLTACITHESSPYEFPTKSIGIEHDRYPAVIPLNICGETKNPEVVWVAALYLTTEHEKLSSDELSKLQSGQQRSYPWDFGGEI